MYIQVNGSLSQFSISLPNRFKTSHSIPGNKMLSIEKHLIIQINKKKWFNLLGKSTFLLSSLTLEPPATQQAVTDPILTTSDSLNGQPRSPQPVSFRRQAQ